MTAGMMLRNTLVRLVVWGAFIAAGFVAVVQTGLTQGPVGGVFATAQSIIQRQTIAVDGNTAMIGPPDAAVPGFAYTRDQFYAVDGPGAAILAVPAVWVGIPLADALKRPDAAILLVGVMAVLLAVLAAAALAWAAIRLGLSPLLGMLAAAIGVGAFIYPVGAMSDAAVMLALVSVLLALAFVDGADSRVEAGWTPHGRLTLCGLLLGFLPFVVWYGGLATVCVGLALVVQGGRRWWMRIVWLTLGAAGPLALFAIANTAWFGQPWHVAWMYAVGEDWQRTLNGRALDTPLTALQASAAALGQLAIRHPLFVVGWIGLVVGLFFVPWRARITTLVLFLAVGIPALIERQPGGIAAETLPLFVLGAFAAAGYVLLVALVARERAAFLPGVVIGSLMFLAAGAVASIVTGGANRPSVVAIGNRPDIYIVPVALAGGVLALLIVPGLHVPRVAPQRTTAIAGVALLLSLLLVGCGTANTGSDAPVSQAPNLLPPVATRLASGTISPLWTLDANARILNDGSTLTAQKDAGTATSPRVPVHATDGYQLIVHVVLPPGVTDVGIARLQWLDGMQRSLGESALALGVGVLTHEAAAPVGAEYARVSVTLPPGAFADTIRLQPRDGARLDALPNYAKAALAFSFDFETAMGGLIHTRGGQTDHDVQDAIARGMQMRDGAMFLDRLFSAYDLRATFYVNGYNFLSGNTGRRVFAGGPTYSRYTAKTAGFASDYWATHPWYGDDPFGTEQSDPAWYFGSLTKRLAQEGHDIESHTFGHLFLHAGITPKELDDDLTEWDRTAAEKGYPPARSFAFPWRASNSVTDEYYAVLAKHGITNVTRFYDLKPGTYGLEPVPAYPQIRVVPDQELIDRQGDEATAMRSIDMTLASGGVYSLWAHPENITSAAAQAIWGRVTAYAADRRSLGLWVAPVTTITNFADARDHLAVSSIRIGGTTRISVQNTGQASVNDATLTLPRPPRQIGWAGDSGTHDTNGPQIRTGNLAPGGTALIEVRYP